MLLSWLGLLTHDSDFWGPPCLAPCVICLLCNPALESLLFLFNYLSLLHPGQGAYDFSLSLSLINFLGMESFTRAPKFSPVTGHNCSFQSPLRPRNVPNWPLCSIFFWTFQDPVSSYFFFEGEYSSPPSLWCIDPRSFLLKYPRTLSQSFSCCSLLLQHKATGLKADGEGKVSH